MIFLDMRVIPKLIHEHSSHDSLSAVNVDKPRYHWKITVRNVSTFLNHLWHSCNFLIYLSKGFLYHSNYFQEIEKIEAALSLQNEDRNQKRVIQNDLFTSDQAKHIIKSAPINSSCENHCIALKLLEQLYLKTLRQDSNLNKCEQPSYFERMTNKNIG